MASHIVPRDVIVVLVVEDGQAGLVVELLKPFNGDANVKLGWDGTLKDALVIVGLGFSSPIENKKQDFIISSNKPI